MKDERSKPDWHRWCRDAELISVDGDNVDVIVDAGRSQRINIRETADKCEFHAVVARASEMDSVVDAAIKVWRRNAATQLVGFKTDNRGRLIASAWIPKVGLEREEFLLIVQRVAFDCISFTYSLVGK